MAMKTCHACHRYEPTSAEGETSPGMPCCSDHRRAQRLSRTDGCHGYLPWLQVAQEVIHRDIQTLHEELNDPGSGCRSVFGRLNRNGRNVLARLQELEALLGQSETIPLTTPKPRQLMGSKTPSVSVYVEVLRDMLAA